MGISSTMDPYGDSDSAVDEFIGDAFRSVKKVSDNIDKVVKLADAIGELPLDQIADDIAGTVEATAEDRAAVAADKLVVVDKAAEAVAANASAQSHAATVSAKVVEMANHVLAALGHRDAAENFANAAAASAGSIASAAVIATNQASTATTQAGIAIDAASATLLNKQAVDAHLLAIEADRAEVQANRAIADQQAALATTKAAEAAGYAAVLGPDVGLFSNLHQIAIPVIVNRIVTAGFSTNNLGQAEYVRWTPGQKAVPWAAWESAVNTLPEWGRNYWWRQDALNAYWVLNEKRPTSAMFGTIGDAFQAYQQSAVVGTDVTVNINRLTCYVQTYGLGDAIISLGKHRVSDTILTTHHLGSTGVTIKGEKVLPYVLHWANAQNNPGSTLITDKNDRPCIALQSMRGGGVVDICISGPISNIIHTQYLGASNGNCTVNDVPRSVWRPDLPFHTYGRYNPGCGIAIDPYCGPAPAAGQGYPDHPSVVGSATYGRTLGSSGVLIQNVTVVGFTVAFAIQPCDFDGNGDYIKFRDIRIIGCEYGFSIGNSQARQVEITNLDYAYVHTVITNVAHGRQIGGLGGVMHNWSGGQSIQLFEFSTGFTGPILFHNCYAEGMWRIGLASGNEMIELHGSLQMEATAAGSGYRVGHNKYRGLPLSNYGPLSGTGENAAPIRIRGTYTTEDVFIAQTPDFEFDGMHLSSHRGSGSTVTPAEALSNNALVGGIFVTRQPGTRTNTRVKARFNLFHVGTGAMESVANFDGETWSLATRNYCSPKYARRITGGGSGASSLRLPETCVSVAWNAFSSRTLTGKTLTLGYAAVSTFRDLFNMSPGDLISHVATTGGGAKFRITEINTTTGVITARLLNGFCEAVAGTVTYPNTSFNLDQGTFVFESGRWHVPTTPLMGDFTSGNATITNVGEGTNSAAAMADAAVIGDVFGFDRSEHHPIDYRAAITGVDTPARTMTCAGWPASATISRQRLIFRRRGVGTISS